MNNARLLDPGDNTMTYKGYTAGIEYSGADDFLVGHILGIRDIVSFHGDSVLEIRLAFEESVDFYLESCAEAGREPNKPCASHCD
jgi:predicted HicB family RNase H-like nuclease